MKVKQSLREEFYEQFEEIQGLQKTKDNPSSEDDQF